MSYLISNCAFPPKRLARFWCTALKPPLMLLTGVNVHLVRSAEIIIWTKSAKRKFPLHFIWCYGLYSIYMCFYALSLFSFWLWCNAAEHNFHNQTVLTYVFPYSCSDCELLLYMSDRRRRGLRNFMLAVDETCQMVLYIREIASRNIIHRSYTGYRLRDMDLEFIIICNKIISSSA
jgi:hypothetical protein